jgi:hypothetical protein
MINFHYPILFWFFAYQKFIATFKTSHHFFTKKPNKNIPFQPTRANRQKNSKQTRRFDLASNDPKTVLLLDIPRRVLDWKARTLVCMPDE